MHAKAPLHHLPNVGKVFHCIAFDLVVLTLGLLVVSNIYFDVYLLFFEIP